jgi:hypothetical protein
MKQIVIAAALIRVSSDHLLLAGDLGVALDLLV